MQSLKSMGFWFMGSAHIEGDTDSIADLLLMP
jgi:hypothetical protein